MSRRWAVLVVMFVAVVIPVALPREPHYRGKRLGEWARMYELGVYELGKDDPCATNCQDICVAVDAICQMRDQVLPRALRLLRSEKPEWKNEVMRFMESSLNVRSWCPSFVWARFYGDPGEDALTYFEVLGSKAHSAVPELTRILGESENPRVLNRARYALSCIAEDIMCCGVDERVP